MRGLQCISAGALLNRRVRGLSELERLRLEQHLTQCDACRREADALEGIVALSEELATPLTERARARAFDHAFAVAASGGEGSVSKPRRARAPVAVAGLLAAAAAASLAFWAWPADESPTLENRVVEGVVFDATGEVITGDLGSADRPMATEDGAVVALGHGSVKLVDTTRIRWESARSRVHLLAGRVEVDVDASLDREYSVRTPDFTVEVRGTRFAVDLSSVTVYEGVVHVTAPDGSVLANELAAGARWERVAAIELAEVAVQSRPRTKARARRRAPRTVAPQQTETPVASPETTPERSAAQWLVHARRHVAARRTVPARRAAFAALAADPGPGEAAEAHTLLAESALVAGNRSAAARSYRTVAQRYPRLRAAENALFAAARLEMELGRRARATRLLRQYLNRYPSGRFRTEVERRLERLERD